MNFFQALVCSDQIIPRYDIIFVSWIWTRMRNETCVIDMRMDITSNNNTDVVTESFSNVYVSTTTFRNRLRIFSLCLPFCYSGSYFCDFNLADFLQHTSCWFFRFVYIFVPSAYSRRLHKIFSCVRVRFIYNQY